MSDTEAVERAATQRRIDLTLWSVARYVERTNRHAGERESIVNALIEAQADVAALAAAAPTVEEVAGWLWRIDHPARMDGFGSVDSPYVRRRYTDKAGTLVALWGAS